MAASSVSYKALKLNVSRGQRGIICPLLSHGCFAVHGTAVRVGVVILFTVRSVHSSSVFIHTFELDPWFYTLNIRTYCCAFSGI